jgi:hypothetical protein
MEGRPLPADEILNAVSTTGLGPYADARLCRSPPGPRVRAAASCGWLVIGWPTTQVSYAVNSARWNSVSTPVVAIQRRAGVVIQ